MRRVLAVLCICMLLAGTAQAAVPVPSDTPADTLPEMLERYVDKDAVLQALQDSRGNIEQMHRAWTGASAAQRLELRPEHAFRLRLLDTDGAEDLPGWFAEQTAYAAPFEGPEVSVPDAQQSANGTLADMRQRESEGARAGVGMVVLARGYDGIYFAENAYGPYTAGVSPDEMMSSVAYAQMDESLAQAKYAEMGDQWLFCAISYDMHPDILRAVQTPEAFRELMDRFGVERVKRVELFMGRWGAGLWVESGEEAIVIANPDGSLLSYAQGDYTSWLRGYWEIARAEEAATQANAEPGAAPAAAENMPLLDRLRAFADSPYGMGLYAIAAILMLALVQASLMRKERKRRAEHARKRPVYRKPERDGIYEWREGAPGFPKDAPRANTPPSDTPRTDEKRE